MKQTAVDYLFKELWDRPKNKMVWFYILERAKQMEKEQMNNSYKEGYFVHFPSDVDFNNYYQQTYEQK